MISLSDRFDNLMNKFKGLTRQKKILCVIGLIILYLGILAISAVITGSFQSFSSSMHSLTEDVETHSALWYGLHDHFLLSFLISVVISAIFVFIMLKTSFANTPKYYDEERGIWVMDDDTMGGQRWLTHEEMQKEFQIGDIKQVTAPIFGQISDNGEQVIGWKKREDGPSGNQNVLCIAPMGTGKTFGPVRVNLLQAARRGESFVCTDPKGELYNSLSDYCRNMGMNVHVLNLAEPRYSEFWNVLEETIDPETERLDSTRLNDFASIYMKNSGDSDHEDFWYGSALNILKSVIGYCAYKHEMEIIDHFVMLYQAITGKVKDANTERMKNTMIGFPECRYIIRAAAAEAGADLDEIEKEIETISKVYKYEFNLNTVFETMLEFDTIAAELDSVPNWHPAKTAYRMFKTNDTDTVRKSALQGAQLRFQIFADEKLKEVLSHDGMHCSDITDKHSAYFVILSDKSETTKPIASLFFSFLFKDVMDAWDKAQSYADARGEKNPRRGLTVMLDEFYSVGIIGGNPRAFGTTMSTSRSREIHIWVILQSYSQLAALYGPDTGNMIQSGCSTILYLGGNDPATTEFIRSFVAGDSSILTESHGDTGGLLSTGPSSSNLSVAKRDFITGEEAKRWRDKVLIAKQATYLAQGNSFPWIQHPAYKLCKQVSIYEQVLPVEKRVERILQEQALIPDPDNYIKNSIEKFIPKDRIASYQSSEPEVPDEPVQQKTRRPLNQESTRTQPVNEHEQLNRFKRRKMEREARAGNLDSEETTSIAKRKTTVKRSGNSSIKNR